MTVPQWMIGRIRAMSGLTLEQIAKAVNVSRRSVQFWRAGGKINSRHEQELIGMHTTIFDMNGTPEQVHLQSLALMDEMRRTRASRDDDINREKP